MFNSKTGDQVNQNNLSDPYLRIQGTLLHNIEHTNSLQAGWLQLPSKRRLDEQKRTSLGRTSELHLTKLQYFRIAQLITTSSAAHQSKPDPLQRLKVSNNASYQNCFASADDFQEKKFKNHVMEQQDFDVSSQIKPRTLPICKVQLPKTDPFHQLNSELCLFFPKKFVSLQLIQLGQRSLLISTI